MDGFCISFHIYYKRFQHHYHWLSYNAIPWGFLIYKTNQHFLSGRHNIERLKCTLVASSTGSTWMMIQHFTCSIIEVSIKLKRGVKVSTYKVETIPGVGRADSAEVAIGGGRHGDTMRGPSDVGQIDA